MEILQANVANSIFEIGTNVTAAGIIIVFAMLIALVVIISLFSKAMHAKEEQPAPKTAPQAASVSKAVASAPAVVAAPAQEDDEIIAVIAAAVEAMYAGTDKRGVVRAVKPASATYHKPWAIAGIYENTIAF